jgi:hypothetical protein
LERICAAASAAPILAGDGEHADCGRLVSVSPAALLDFRLGPAGFSSRVVRGRARGGIVSTDRALPLEPGKRAGVHSFSRGQQLRLVGDRGVLSRGYGRWPVRVRLHVDSGGGARGPPPPPPAAWWSRGSILAQKRRSP